MTTLNGSSFESQLTHTHSHTHVSYFCITRIQTYFVIHLERNVLEGSLRPSLFKVNYANETQIKPSNAVVLVTCYVNSCYNFNPTKYLGLTLIHTPSLIRTLINYKRLRQMSLVFNSFTHLIRQVKG